MGILSWIVFIPLITALVIIANPSSNPKWPRWIALAGASLHLLVTAFLSYLFVNQPKGTQPNVDSLVGAAGTKTTLSLSYVEQFDWFKTMGVQYLLGIDGISLAMIVLTSIVIFTGVLASWSVEKRSREFFALLLILVTGVFGVFVSFDLFLFFVFYEVAVLPMYLLIGIWGTGAKEYSAMKLTLMLMVGSAFLLVGILALFHYSGLATFDLQKLALVDFSDKMQQWVFPMLFLGFGVLGALFPFHTWSPDGHASAPTAVSMLHAGVLMKLGGYGILRVALYLLPKGAVLWAPFFLLLATINIIYGAFGAIKQKDLKYFTAYSSVSHCGFVLFGLCTLNLMGLKGAVLQMVSHGIMTALFFALIGMVYQRTHSRMIPDLGGLAERLPWFTVCFYIGGLASLGLPGLSGFVAEAHVFLGGFWGNRWYPVELTRPLTIIATASVVVTAVYVLRGLAATFLGPASQNYPDLTPATFYEKIVTGTLILSIVIMGLFPFLFLDLIEVPLLPILQRLSSGN